MRKYGLIGGAISIACFIGVASVYLHARRPAATISPRIQHALSPYDLSADDLVALKTEATGGDCRPQKFSRDTILTSPRTLTAAASNGSGLLRKTVRMRELRLSWQCSSCTAKMIPKQPRRLLTSSYKSRKPILPRRLSSSMILAVRAQVVGDWFPSQPTRARTKGGYGNNLRARGEASVPGLRCWAFAESFYTFDDANPLWASWQG
jgi:hypothetical protein